MPSIKLRSRVGADGILHLEVPVGLIDTELEITLTIQPVALASKTKTPEELSWEPGFIEKTYGSCANDPIVIDERGISEELDDDLEGVFDKHE